MEFKKLISLLLLSSTALAAGGTLETVPNDLQVLGVLNATHMKPAGQSTNRACYMDGSGYLTSSPTTSTELGYLHGVTSDLQSQIDSKGPSLGFTPINKAGDTGIAPLTINQTDNATKLTLQKHSSGDSGDLLDMKDQSGAVTSSFDSSGGFSTKAVSSFNNKVSVIGTPGNVSMSVNHSVTVPAAPTMRDLSGGMSYSSPTLTATLNQSASGRTVQTFTDDAYISFKLSDVSTQYIVGFGSDATWNGGNPTASIDFGVDFELSPYYSYPDMIVFINGGDAIDLNTQWASTDTITLERVGGNFLIKQNGTLIYTFSPVTSNRTTFGVFVTNPTSPNPQIQNISLSYSNQGTNVAQFGSFGDAATVIDNLGNFSGTSAKSSSWDHTPTGCPAGQFGAYQDTHGNFGCGSVSIDSGMVTGALGYTPANRAGDTFTGDVQTSSGHNFIAGHNGQVETTDANVTSGKDVSAYSGGFGGLHLIGGVTSYFTNNRTYPASATNIGLGMLDMVVGFWQSTSNQHPTCTVGASAGTGAFCSVNGAATDTAGYLQIVTGSGTTAGVAATLNFLQPHVGNIICTATRTVEDPGDLPPQEYAVQEDETGNGHLKLYFIGSTTDHSNMAWLYHCFVDAGVP